MTDLRTDRVAIALVIFSLLVDLYWIVRTTWNQRVFDRLEADYQRWKAEKQ